MERSLCGHRLPGSTRWIPPSPTSETVEILALTNDGLVGFQHTGGLEGTTLVPDLARSLPEPTDGGRTYTFQLREGSEYSTGEPVRPEDFRRAIERVFANLDADGNPSGGVPYFSGIVGARRVRARPGNRAISPAGSSPTTTTAR